MDIPNIDAEYVFPFIEWLKQNAIFIGLVFVALKSIAKATPWAGDDKIVSMLKGIIERLVGGQSIDKNSEENSETPKAQ